VVKWEALRGESRSETLAGLLVACAFAMLFWRSASTLAVDWWTDPDAGHGLLLAPVALYLAVKRGWSERAVPQPILGMALLVVAVLLRYAAQLAAELFTLRFSMLLAACALIVFARGARQLAHWWLPALLLLLCIPLPSVVLQTLAFPLQLQASRIGATLLSWRYVPVLLAGNVIYLPGHSLFVTEACSGLRSLTALLALALLIAGTWLRWPASRVTLVLAAIPVAVLLNGFRVFLIGFLVYYVDPRLGEGLMHYTEGWLIFLAAFGILGSMGWALQRLEWMRRAPA
jgi:exosortase